MSDDNYSIIENKSFVEDCSSKILDEEKVCRTCLNISKSFNEIKVQGNDEYLINMVTMCLPQLNFTLTKDPIICQNCISKLEEFHKFLIVCLNIEERLINYCSSWNAKFPVNLANILHVTVKEIDAISVKSEDQQIKDIDIKIEEDILREQVHLQNNNSEHEHQKKPCAFNNIFSKGIKNEPFQCHTCNALFPTKSKLDKHTLTHNIPCIFTCDKCKSEFKYKRSFEKHLQAHVNNGQVAKQFFSCNICGKFFDRKAKMRKHQEIHIVKKKPFVCNACGKRFINEELLKSHIHRVHGPEKAFNCELCGNKYARKSGLDFHMKSHFSTNKSKPKRDLMCDFCGKLFYGKYSLEKHRMSHTGEKPFECEQCNMKFKERYNLTIHMRRHTGEKPYECKVCNFKFASKSRLSIHLRIHSGVKPFSCKICEMAFNRKDHLIKHVRAIHTGEKPFLCDNCDKTFGRRDHLLKHKKIHIKKLL